MKPKFTVMLQARMGSTRLPGKVLSDFNGVPMIEHIYRQVQSIQSVDLDFVLSTSPDEKDDALASWAGTHGIKVVRHNVDDIVGRLFRSHQAAKNQGLIRVWGDCVFICPDVIESMLAEFLDKNYDYVTNAGTNRNLPVGLDAEIYSAPYLEKLEKLTDVFLREYPFKCATETPGVRWFAYAHPVSMPVLNLTVDYPEDLAAAKKISTLLKAEHSAILFPQLHRLFQTQPELFNNFSKQERQAEFKQKLTTWSTKGST